MKIQYFVASITVAAGLVAPTAFSAPVGGGTQVTHFLTRLVSVSGTSLDGDYFRGDVYDDLKGVAQGSVYYVNFDPNYSTISCTGPAYANAVSVNSKDGSSTFNATLDPSNPACESFNVSAPITVSAVGQANGYTISSIGKSEETFDGLTIKFNTQDNKWLQTFSVDNGFYLETYDGYSETSRRNERQKVR